MSFGGENCSRIKPKMSFVNLLAGGCGGATRSSLVRFYCEALAGSRLMDRENSEALQDEVR